MRRNCHFSEAQLVIIGNLEVEVGLEEVVGSRLECVFRPALEPIDSCAVHNGREVSEPSPEGISHGLHADDEV